MMDTKLQIQETRDHQKGYTWYNAKQTLDIPYSNWQKNEKQTKKPVKHKERRRKCWRQTKINNTLILI